LNRSRLPFAHHIRIGIMLVLIYVGSDPSLIDEDQTLRGKPALMSPPPIPPLGDVGAVLLTGQPAF